MATRPPFFLAFSSSPSTRSFAILAGMENLTRSMVAPIIPLQGLALLKSEALTSGALFFGSLCALVTLLCGGFLIRRLTRKVVFTLSMLGVVGSTALLALPFAESFVFGAALRVACAGLNILCLSLYVFDFVPKQKFGDSESKRVFWSALAWMIGPIIGAYLYQQVHVALPYLLTSLAVVVQLGFFWHLRINDAERIVQPTIGDNLGSPQRSLLTLFKQFFGRPELRRSYVIPLVRSIFWVSLFTYLPFYVAETAIAPQYLGFVFAAFQLGLMASGLIRRVSIHVGIRRFIVLAFAYGCLFMTLMALMPGPSVFGIGLWFMAILAAVALDVAGNVPFMRLVPVAQRTEMTMVFSTWRDLSFAVTPGVGYVLLTLGNNDLSWIFWANALAYLVAGIYAWRLPPILDVKPEDADNRGQ